MFLVSEVVDGAAREAGFRGGRSSLGASEHERTLVEDGDRVFEVSGDAAVLGDDCPLVVEYLDVRSAGIYHRFDGDDKAALEPATKAGLEALGHKLEYHDAWGDAEAVMVDPLTSLRTAASDPRNEGAPAGIDGPVK